MSFQWYVICAQRLEVELATVRTKLESQQSIVVELREHLAQTLFEPGTVDEGSQEGELSRVKVGKS